MGILELMLGQSSAGDGATMANSYVLAEETHDEVYPVAVRRAEIDALREASDALEAAPSLEENRDELERVFEGFGDDAAIDVDDLVEQTRSPRQAIEPLLGTWDEQVPDGTDLGVVYLLPGSVGDVRAFVSVCKQRADHEHDPFELPDGFGHVAALLKRIEDVAAGQYRAVIHTDLVPAAE
ncbi:hypothetical protein ACFO5R_20115 [Halosolutus amylolyticus]|uniref:Uncharacterized protein n=1 Tax=Halosolutus amylolyticus TaxID=2932267 RepID=A0ABD5PUV9_9EURY|nr:hypothetical protein [Halosolutus amylolyticus]